MMTIALLAACTSQRFEATGGGAASFLLATDGSPAVELEVAGLEREQLRDLVRGRTDFLLEPGFAGAWQEPHAAFLRAYDQEGMEVCGQPIGVAEIEIQAESVYLYFDESTGSSGFVDPVLDGPALEPIGATGAAEVDVRVQCPDAPDTPGTLTVTWAFDPETTERHTRREWDYGVPLAE